MSRATRRHEPPRVLWMLWIRRTDRQATRDGMAVDGRRFAKYMLRTYPEGQAGTP
jgi:hypothetical protein